MDSIFFYVFNKLKVDRNVISNLNRGTLSKGGQFGQDQVSGTFGHGPAVTEDVLDRIKHPARGPCVSWGCCPGTIPLPTQRWESHDFQHLTFMVQVTVLTARRAPLP